MSPEQLRGEVLTAASDVWALSLLLWEMLAEAKPWSDGAAGEAGVAETLQRVAAHGANIRMPPVAVCFPLQYVESIWTGLQLQVRVLVAPM